MIPIAWLAVVGLAGILGGAAVVSYWDDILEWLHDFLPKISELVKLYAKEFGPEFEHTAIMVADVIDAVNAQIEHKLYHKISHQEWMEETTTREIIEDEVPPYIRAKITEHEVEITHEMEMELGISI